MENLGIKALEFEGDAGMGELELAEVPRSMSHTV
jgi:hypothetical protein